MNTKAERHRAIDLAFRLPNKHPANVTHVANLMGWADRLHRYAETDCNYGLTPNQAKRVERLGAKVREVCALLGVGVRFNTDPRGYAVKLLLPSGDYNTWGGKEEGWGI